MSSEPERKRVKRIVPFLEAHEYMYGVRVVERNPDTREVTSVLCMFCAAFGREDAPRETERKRAQTQRPKYWSGPTFRTDNYKSHLSKQHPNRWDQYQNLPPEQKQRYFDSIPAIPKKQEKPRRSMDSVQAPVNISAAQSPTPIRPPIATPTELADANNETTKSAPASPTPAQIAVTSEDQALVSPLELNTGEVLTFLLDRDIVDVALGDVLFRAEDVNPGVGKSLAVFESTLDKRDTLDQQKSDGTAEVRVVVRSVKLFHRVVELVAIGLSFDQTATICQTQMSTRISDNTFVPQMARAVVGANLQTFSRILQQSWAFSLSLQSVDRSRPGGKERRMFLDVRVRVYCAGKMEAFHLLALPVRTGGDPSRTSEMMFDTLTTFLEAIHKRWLQKIIGCSTEATSSDVSVVAFSLVRRIEQQALPGFVRVSSARPPMDSLMQQFFDSVLFADNAEWYSQLTSLAAYLERQMATGNADELSAASVTTCPHVGDTIWCKMTKVMRWFDNARVSIQRLLARRNASVAPSPSWWLNLKIALVVGTIAIKTRASLQGGYATLMSQQPQRISMLRLALAGDVGVEGPLPAYQRAALRDQSSLGEMIGSSDGMFAVKPHSIVAFIRGMGSWCAELFDGLDTEERQQIIVNTADRMLDLVQGLHRLAEELEERGGSNASLSAFPPVLPHQIALLNAVDFQEMMRVYRPRMSETYSDTKLAAVETQHQELRTAASSDADVQRLLEKSAKHSSSTFEQAWGTLGARWGLLAGYCGGLATVFPTSKGGSSASQTFGAESSQRKLADFTLEATLQCQQFDKLQALA
ncbi:hypothetical protein GN244_ATG04997 [Phytophthora infestans]|uniref:Uncharacterized protein n=1 Tax=Phytophthora infestans TaxID=4787 RepID=A0A833SLH0_PHYIN|nr:hypothetical protein GN244_ATG04997 [Phytophthora infestans]